MRKHNYTRLVLLVREGVDVTLKSDLVHEDIAWIWVSMRNGNQRSINIGGIYREHCILLKPKPNLTVSDSAQLDRWNVFLASWKKASNDNMCCLIGDTNLDHIRWEDPDPAHIKMVDRTKYVIELAGFTQILCGITRTWRGQTDSLLDQCWVNNPQRIISHSNEKCGSSDHNFISVIIRTNDTFPAGQEMCKRVWKNFDPKVFRHQVSLIDWKDFYGTKNVELKNSIFEGNIYKILDRLKQYKNIQIRRVKMRNWVDAELKDLMNSRDKQREVAKYTDREEDWAKYRFLRNSCTKMIKIYICLLCMMTVLSEMMLRPLTEWQRKFWAGPAQASLTVL